MYIQSAKKIGSLTFNEKEVILNLIQKRTIGIRSMKRIHKALFRLLAP